MSSESNEQQNAPKEQKLPPGVVSVALHKEERHQPHESNKPPGEHKLTPIEEANLHGTILDKARVGGVRHKFLYDKDGNKIPPPSPPHLVDVSHHPSNHEQSQEK